MLPVLLLVQGVTFGVVTYRHLTSDASRSREESSYVLNGREQFNVSAEGNVIVFLLDYFSNDYVDAAEKAYPGLLAPFHDFTYYDNCDSTYIRSPLIRGLISPGMVQIRSIFLIP